MGGTQDNDDWQARVYARAASPASHVAEPPRPIKRPTGWLSLLGLALLVAAQFVNWGLAVNPEGETWDLGSRAQSVDGVPALIAAAILCAILLSASMAESKTRIFHWLPGLLGAVSLLLTINGVQDVADAIAQPWHPAGGFGLGVWIALAGGIASFASGAVITFGRVRRSGEAAVDRAAIARRIVPIAVGFAAGSGLAALSSLALGLGPIRSGVVIVAAALVGPILALVVWSEDPRAAQPR